MTKTMTTPPEPGARAPSNSPSGSLLPRSALPVPVVAPRDPEGELPVAARRPAADPARPGDPVRDVYRFGCLSAVQLALRHWPDSVSDKTARNRLWQLREAGYLEHRPIGHREDEAYLLTPKGRAELGLPAKHARPDPRAATRCATAWSWPTSPTGCSPGATAAGSRTGSPRSTSTTAGSGWPGGEATGERGPCWCPTGCWCSEAGTGVAPGRSRWSCTRRPPGSTRPSWPGLRRPVRA